MPESGAFDVGVLRICVLRTASNYVLSFITRYRSRDMILRVCPRPRFTGSQYLNQLVTYNLRFLLFSEIL